jgi:hypothetical protein
MGGLTQFEPGEMSRPQRWLVSFAGPAVGLSLGIGVALATHFYPVSSQARPIIASILWVNIGWSLVNLLPVLPFDGGQMMSAFLGPKREFWTAIISAAVGATAAILGYLRLNSLWIAFLFGSAAVSGIRQARLLWLSKADHDAGLDDELARARACIARGEVDEVSTVGEGIVARARTSQTRNAGRLAQAWAHATRGRQGHARDIIEKLERDAPADPYLVAAVEDALGSPERARAWLEAERRQGIKRPESIKLLIDLYAREGDLERAVDTATEALDVLSRADAEAVLAAAVAGGASGAASRLKTRLEELPRQDASVKGRAAAKLPPDAD